jgi:hypothetical protein
LLVTIAGCGAAAPVATHDECAPARAQAAEAWQTLGASYAPSSSGAEVEDLDALRSTLQSHFRDGDAEFVMPDAEAEMMANALMDAIDRRERVLPAALRDRAESGAETLLTQRRGENGARAAREAIEIVEQMRRVAHPDSVRDGARLREQAMAISRAYGDDPARADALIDEWVRLPGDENAIGAAEQVRARCRFDRTVSAPSL